MSDLKTYVRKQPFVVRARFLEEGEVVYDASGSVLGYQPGDALIELSTDRYVLDRTLFDQLYGVQENGSEQEHQGLPPVVDPELGRR